jgi:hypothetical protein
MCAFCKKIANSLVVRVLQLFVFVTSDRRLLDARWSKHQNIKIKSKVTFGLERSANPRQFSRVVSKIWICSFAVDLEQAVVLPL